MAQFVLIKIPTFGSVGLGNMLFIWARGVSFASKFNLPYHTTSWFKTIFYFRSFLIGRKEKRDYSAFFVRRTNYLRFLLNLVNNKRVIEPSFDSNMSYHPNTFFIFNNLPHWSNYFKDIKDHKEIIRTEFYKMLSKKVLNELNNYEIPCIAVHIRLGDFVAPEFEKDFKLQGQARTPITYFIQCIFKIRQISGNNLPVTVFSNGSLEELKDVLALSNVKLSPTKKYDIVDLVLMSKSKLLIGSATSTFSFWAAFLGDMPFINHYDHLHEDFRDLETNKIWFEGGVNPEIGITNWPILLKQNIIAIQP